VTFLFNFFDELGPRAAAAKSHELLATVSLEVSWQDSD
jgi:hypothetical protein